MTATVIQGTKRGTGAKVSQIIYENNTGGNVRLIIYFMNFHSRSMGSTKTYMGPDAPNDDNLGHTSGSYPNTVEFDPGADFWFGKSMAVYMQSDVNNYNAGGNTGYHPTEMILANGYKLYVYSNEQYLTDDRVCQYSMVAIPE